MSPSLHIRSTQGLRFSRFRAVEIVLSLLFALTPVPATRGADKSGVSPNSISVPKGPGSIEGLGESFQPTLNTGTAKYKVPIKLAPGIADHQPELSLSYDGGAGNGVLGYGWTIGLPRIQRRTDKGIPTYGENLGVPRADTFINEAKEELVPRADGFFFCENEGAFIRYRQVGDHWEGTTPDGTRLEFGLTASGRIEDTAASHTFCWLLERETDTHGNVIEYGHRSFPGEQNLNQKYLSSIRYGPGAPPWSHFHFVTLEYEDRPDWFEDGRAGFLVRTGRRLRSITAGTQGAGLPGHLAGDFNGDGTTDHLNRRYDLRYLAYAGVQSHWSLLDRVSLVGADGVTTLPPSTFAYAVSNPPDQISAQQSVWTGVNEPTAVMDSPLVDLIDLNADGLPDILKTDSGGGAHTVAVNRGPVQVGGGWGIQWAPLVDVASGGGTAWSFDLGSERTHLADMNGDGLADLVHKNTDDSVFYFANRGKLGWAPRQDLGLEGASPPAPFGNPGVRTADIDFDKRIDVIQSIDVGNGAAYRVWFNLGGQGYSVPITVDSGAGLDFALPGVELADCNGDRVPDAARIQAGGVRVAAGLGYARFAEFRTMALPDLTLDDLQIARAKLTDLNGDGLADLVIERAAPGECWYWLNLGNYTLSPRKAIIDLPAATSMGTTVRWADLNGNGTTDLIYADSQGSPRLQLIEIGELISGGLNPNLLTRIDNGIGRVTHIEYASSTHFALADAAAGRPWPESVPFPVTVVASVKLGDSLGHEYVTRFRYHDGYYDYVEKQFRGFGEVEKVDVGDPTAPTLVGRSLFDTGLTFDAMKGRLLRSSTETEDGLVFENETTRWADPPRLLMTGTNGVPVRYAHAVGSTKQVTELGQGTPRQLESEVDYDDFGNLIRQADYGVVEGGQRSAFDDERITLTEYALNLNAWILRRPKREVVQDENGAVISRSEFFYDDETFSGNNLGQVTVGNLTLQRDWIQPTNASAFVSSARTKYDTYGNPIFLLDPLAVAPGGEVDFSKGHVRELIFDPAFPSYPTSEKVHVGGGSAPLVYAGSYDHGFGLVMSTLDFNTNASSFGYDAFGRLTRIIKPLNGPSLPTAEYSYVIGAPAPYWDSAGILHTGVVNYVESRQLDRAAGGAGDARDHYLISRQFLDGLGRAVMTKGEAEAAPGQTTPRVVVSGAVQFNARQGTARTLNPFFTLMTGSLSAQLEFENIEGPGWAGRFHHNGALVDLNLAAAHRTETRYDATMRVVQVTNADGTRNRTDYRPLITSNLDENDTDQASPHAGTPLVHQVDGLGRLIQTDEVVRLTDSGSPSGSLNTWVTRYVYNLNDCLTRIIDSQGNIKEIGYDGLKRRTSLNDPDRGVSTNIYDAGSNLIESRDARNQRVTRTYDGVDRLLTEDYHDENSPFSHGRSPDVVYHYDKPLASLDAGDGTRVTAGNACGTLAWVSDTSGEEHLSYDARGRMEWAVKRIPDPLLQANPASSSLVAYRTKYSYDSKDRVVQMVYPDNDRVTYHYNARGLLERIAGGPNGNVISGLEYLPSGQPNRIDFGNGVRTDYAYDPRLRTRRLSTRHETRGSELIDFGYDFDGVSNIRGIQDLRSATALSASDPRRNSQAFQYDDLYRLSQVRYNSPSPVAENGGQIQCRYDRIGNLLGQASDIGTMEKGLPVANLGTLGYGGAAGRFNRHGRRASDAPGPHALTDITSASSESDSRLYEYDANGNMTMVDGLRCTWDFNDRLVVVEDDTMRAEYTYDYTGRRVSKKITRPGVPGSQASVTVYVGQQFEIRDADQPTKYVFNGSTRVARVIGSLSTNPRIQRLRLHAGPNLVSLAVTAVDLAGQLQAGGASIKAVQQWNESTATYSTVAAGQTIPAGAVLWLHAASNAVVSVVGAPAELGPRVTPPGGHYLAGPGFEAWSPNLPSPLGVWAYSAAAHQWQAHLPGALPSDIRLPETFPPGQVLYVTADEQAELAIPDPALRICYYHQDHLGSSSVMTDANGELVEETAYLPSGLPRHEHQLRPVIEPYGFAQKERDAESGLSYFEARYLTAGLGRFASPDPKYASPDGLTGTDLTAFLTQPQRLNLYAYALNNPLRYNDPTGLDDVDKVGWVNDAVGLAAGAADELDTWTSVLPNAGGTVVKVAGKTTAVISVGLKTAQFINDPTEANGAQLANEGAKTLTSIAIPPVGLIWAGLDLIGFGPSQILDATEKSRQANIAATKALKQATKTYEATTKMINTRLPKIQQQMKEAEQGLKKLNAATAKLKMTRQQELDYLNQQIKSLERTIVHQKRELRYHKARQREAEKGMN